MEDRVTILGPKNQGYSDGAAPKTARKLRKIECGCPKADRRSSQEAMDSTKEEEGSGFKKTGA